MLCKETIKDTEAITFDPSRIPVSHGRGVATCILAPLMLANAVGCEGAPSPPARKARWPGARSEPGAVPL